ncbi:MAG: alpha/beta hydrolase fold domain-containing protein [Clostridia bacterium]
MNSKRYAKSLQLGKFLNFSERIAQVLLYRRVPKGITMQRNIPYSSNSKYQVTDLIFPSKSNGKMPLLLYIHGGGWISGLKDMRHTYCFNYAKAGYFVANIDYEYSPYVQYPTPIQQCLNAVDYLFDNAEKYNIDTSRIILGGESAGGYFVCMLAAIAKDKSLLDRIGLSLKHTEFDVVANIVISGAFDIIELATSKFLNMDVMLEAFTNLTNEQILSSDNADKVYEMSPVSHVQANYPPTMIVYATHDPLRIESFDLHKKLNEFNVPNMLYKCDGILLGNHAWAIATVVKKAKLCVQATINFVNTYVNSNR